MTYTPILCLDFDGVIHGYQSGWKGAGNIPDMPVPGAIDFILKAVEAGWDVQIFSSRSKNPFGRLAMKRWLARHIGYAWLDGHNSPTLAEAECLGDAREFATHKIKWPWFKPAAMVTLDDRAIQFTGEWPDPSELRKFKPWRCPLPVELGDAQSRAAAPNTPSSVAAKD